MILLKCRKKNFSYDNSFFFLNRLETEKKIQDFELRFLIRRGNAYLKTNQLYHAKSDLENAFKIDPKNAQIKKDMDSVL